MCVTGTDDHPRDRDALDSVATASRPSTSTPPSATAGAGSSRSPPRPLSRAYVVDDSRVVAAIAAGDRCRESSASLTAYNGTIAPDHEPLADVVMSMNKGVSETAFI